MTEILHASGFLGTNANFAADMTLVLMVLIAGLFTYGLYLARKGGYEQHKWVQTAGAGLNLILVLWLMVLPFRDFVVRDLGGPRSSFFYTITRLHAVVGATAVVLGNFVVLRGHKLVPKRLRFSNYKPFMRAAYIFYMLTTALGVWVYWTWFVIEPTPPVF